ncbi:MAG: efflux transporter outer membrane subunit, partial [Myxococcota bacterium]
MSRYAHLAAVALALPLGACGALLHSVEESPTPTVPVTKTFTRGLATSSVAVGRWWSSFGDPALDDVMKLAVLDNLDLKRARARLKQAQAIRKGANAAWFPQIDLNANGSRSKSAFQFGSFENNQFDLSVAASYELDLWGRVNFTTEAAALDFKASVFDLEAMAMSVSAQVAETWFQLVEARATLDLLRRQLDTNRTFLELVEYRFGQGQVGALDVLQQRQQVAATESQMPQVEASVAVLQNALAVLLARSPSEAGLPKQAALPGLPPAPAVGVPATLLQRRPDVMAAQARVMAADNRIGAAIADQFPTIRLSASAGYRSFTELGDLFDNFVWNLAGGLAGPLFDGLRRRAEVDRTKAVLEDQMYAYGQVVLTAFREVEDALVQEEKQRNRLAQLDAQVDLAKTTLDQAKTRYVNGLSDYLPV